MPVSQPLSGKMMIAHLSPKNYNTKRVVSMTNQKRTTSMRSASSATPSELDNMMGAQEVNQDPDYR